MVTYYHCDRSENKQGPHKKKCNLKPRDRKKSIRDMTSKLYHYEIQINVVVSKISKCSSSLTYAIIYIHSKYSSHK